MFDLFTLTRKRSYFESNPSAAPKCLEANKYKIHRFSQLYRDAYELQRYFMTKRDELCRNGEMLNSPALSYKPHALENHIAALIAPSVDPNFDENDALLVEERYRPLEKSLHGLIQSNSASVRVGNYYLFSRDLVKSSLSRQVVAIANNKRTDPIIVCVCALDTTHLVGQLYLQPDDDEFVDQSVTRLKKFLHHEVIKSDLYVKIDIKKIESEVANANCLVIGIRQFVTFEPNFDTPSGIYLH